jgi:hypothetical protein
MKRFGIGILLGAALMAALAASALSQSTGAGGPAAYVYNSVADLLAGDLYEVTTRQHILDDVSALPRDWPLMGVGTTSQVAKNGEIFVLGTVGDPQIFWADPVYPQPVRAITDEALPFMAVAGGDPASAIIAPATPGQPIHAQVRALAEAHGLLLAGVRISGEFGETAYSVAYNLEKHGTPLHDPSVDKGPYQLLLSAPSAADWEFSGFYAATEALQALVSVVGAPVHLHGMQADGARSGHIGAATTGAAEIRLYPLPPPVRRECDLIATELRVTADTVKFNLVNVGENTVAHASVEGWIGNRRVFQRRLSDLSSGQPQEISLELTTPDDPGSLRVVVDPYNEILEKDESNNVTANTTLSLTKRDPHSQAM